VVEAVRYYGGLWYRIVRLKTLSGMQYRTSFFVGTIFAIIFHAFVLSVQGVVVYRFPELRGWGYAELALLYGFYVTVQALIDALGARFGYLPWQVLEGGLDRHLMRPGSPLLLLTLQGARVPVVDLLTAVLILSAGWAFARPHFTPATALFLAAALLGAGMVEYAVRLGFQLFCFWWPGAGFGWITVIQGEASRFPISLLGRSIQAAFTLLVPIAFIAYYPARLLLGKADDGALLPLWAGYLTPLVGLSALALVVAIWHAGLRRYQGAGH
jgi:ABC-2 type transport system permease protein